MPSHQRPCGLRPHPDRSPGLDRTAKPRPRGVSRRRARCVNDRSAPEEHVNESLTNCLQSISALTSGPPFQSNLCLQETIVPPLGADGTRYQPFRPPAREGHTGHSMRNPRRSHVLRGHGRIITPGWRRGPALAAAAVTAAALTALAPAAPALAAGNAPGAPGANATWNESNLQGFADSLGSASKVWYTLGNGELENVF